MNGNYKDDLERNDDMPVIKVSVKKGGKQSVSAVKKGRGEIVIGQKRVAAEEKKAALGINADDDEDIIGENDVVIGVRKGGGGYIGGRSVSSVKKPGVKPHKRPAPEVSEPVRRMEQFDDEPEEKPVSTPKERPAAPQRPKRMETFDNDERPERPERPARVEQQEDDELAFLKPAPAPRYRPSAPSRGRNDQRPSNNRPRQRRINVVGAVNDTGEEMLRFPKNARNNAEGVKRGVMNYRGEAVKNTGSYAKSFPSRASDLIGRHRESRRSAPKSKWRTVGVVAACFAGIVLVVGLIVFIIADSLMGKINYVRGDEYGEMTASEADAYLREQLSLTDIEGEDYSDTDIVDVEPTEEEQEPAERNAKKLDQFTSKMYDVKKEDVYNVLLLGTDSRSEKYVRDNSDSMILCSLNKKNNTIKLTSFMRDSYISIPGHGKSRLNAAFAIGGPNLLFKTLKSNFDVDVDKFVRVNFIAFKKAVDAVGGIDMEVTSLEAKYMCSNKKYGKFPEYKKGAGTYHMNGAAALNYARIRKIDSDFGRTERQRKVLVALASEVKDSGISELMDLMNEILPCVETNLTKSEIISLISAGISSLKHDIETLNVPVNGAWSNQKVGSAQVLGVNLSKNKKAIKAHIYSTTPLSLAKPLSVGSISKGTSESKATLKTSASTTAKETKRTAQTKKTSN